MTTGDPAREGFEALVDAIHATGELVRSADRGATTADDRAAGYLYATELARVALDLYVDGDGQSPGFVPFSSPTPYHAGAMALQRVQGGANPDGLYDFVSLDPDRSYRITGHRGNDCYMSLSFSGGTPGEWPDRTAATLNDRQMTYAPDGAFEVIVSDTPRDGNWVRMEPDICSLIVRQYFDEPPSARMPATLSIEALSEPSGTSERSEQSVAERLNRRLLAAAAFVRSTNSVFPFPAGLPENGFAEPLGYSGEAGALGTTDNSYVMGAWRLAHGEALVVETSPVPCGYWSLQLWNHWGQSLAVTVDDGNYDRLIINGRRAETQPDGSVRIVVAHDDPGEPNWLDTFGWTEGFMIVRYLYPDAAPERPDTGVSMR